MIINKMKIFTLIMSLILLFGIAACSSKSNTEGSEGNQSGNKTIINYLTYEGLPETKEVLEKQFKEFEEQNPGVKIEPFYTSPEALRQQISTMLQSGNHPDVVNLDLPDAILYSSAGLLHPVTGIVEQIGDIPDNRRATIDGEDYMVTNNLKFTYSWYRSDVFEKEGIKPPKTWEEFLDVSESLTKNGMQGYVVVSNETGDYPVSTLQSYAFSNGVTFIDDNDEVVFDKGDNRERLIETLNFLKEMSKYSPPGSNFGWGDIIDTYSSGKVAIADYVGSRLYNVTAQNNQEIATSTLPMAQPYGESPANKSSTEGYMIFKGSKQKEMAEKLILHLRTGENYLEYLWSNPLHLLPVDRDLFNGDFQKGLTIDKKDEIVKVINEIWEDSRNETYDFNGKKASSARAKVYTSTIYNKMISRVINSNMDPGESIDIAAEEARKLIEE